MTVRIVTDSTCDLSQNMIDDYHITVLPLYVQLGENSFKDGMNITSEEIFAYVSKNGSLPKTMAVSKEDFVSCFSALRTKYPDDEIVCITIGSKLSDCFQNALEASGDFQHIYVVDSMNLSTGLGQVVMTAAELAEQGSRGMEIKKYLETEIIPNVDASFIVDRLDYLYKGGRCSAVEALGANLLRLKPCIEVKNGELKFVKRYHGSFESCVEQYVRDRLQSRDDVQMHRIFITHSNTSRKSIQIAEENIRVRCKFEHIDETNAGCTVCSHCGPNTLGVLFLRKYHACG